MKNIVFIVCFIISICFVQNAHAQLSKKEKKEWKKRQKSLPIEEFKRIVEESSSLKGKVSSLEGQVSSLQSRVGDKDAELNRLKSDLQAAREEAANATVPVVESGNETRSAQGVVFKVQIGAYKNKDMTKYNSTDGDFTAENDGDVQKFTLGSFGDYWEADSFKKHLRQMGVKDAWIVPYKDGIRVPIKDVLEGIVN